MLKKGFTLIELSVVLIIAGVLSGFGLMAVMKAVTGDIKRNGLAREASLAAEKVIQYAQSNGFKLPDNDRFEKFTETGGLSYYHYTAGGAVDGVCGVISTDMTALLCYDAECIDNKTIKNVAFAVISHGMNKNIESADKDGNIIIRPKGSYVNGARYDDAVEIFTITELKNRLDCGGELRIITETLPPVVRNKNFKGIRIDASGGVKPYKWCVTEDTSRRIFNETDTAMLRITDDTDKAIRASGSCTEGTDDNIRESQYITIGKYGGAGNINIRNGNYKITVYVTDKAGRMIKKSFVLTVTGAE